MVFLPHIFDGFGAAFVTEVDVEVRHRNAVGVQESLEEQVVLEGVDVRDADGVGDDTRSAAAAPGADGDSPLF